MKDFQNCYSFSTRQRNLISSSIAPLSSVHRLVAFPCVSELASIVTPVLGGVHITCFDCEKNPRSQKPFLGRSLSWMSFCIQRAPDLINKTCTDTILDTSQNLCTSPRLCLATEPSTLVESVSDLLFLFFWFTASSPLRLILSALLAPTQGLERPPNGGGGWMGETWNNIL